MADDNRFKLCFGCGIGEEVALVASPNFFAFALVLTQQFFAGCRIAFPPAARAGVISERLADTLKSLGFRFKSINGLVALQAQTMIEAAQKEITVGQSPIFAAS